MKQFLIDNWRLILEGICVVTSLVFCLLRKKPVRVVDTIKELVLRLLPGLVNQAEIKIGPGKGSDKLAYVIDTLKGILKEFGYGDEVISEYLPFALDQVEVILSTPQKKG